MKCQLVQDVETGEIRLMVSHGTHSATLRLPDGYGLWTEQQLRDYLELTVPDMINGLFERRQDEIRSLRD